MYTILTYDNSFNGFLTAVFDVYERKLKEVRIMKISHFQPVAFAQIFQVNTEAEKAKRVWDGLKKKLSPTALQEVYYCFLSEKENIELLLLQFIRYVMANKTSIEDNYANEYVLQVAQTGKEVSRERHRMKAFVRFRQAKDDLYYATIDPDFNVLPIIAGHFKARYADQCWLIYDMRRKYGIYYDKNTVNEIALDTSSAASQNIKELNDAREPLYNELWNAYFKHTNIPARKNIKLHIKHVPKRYWKYLTEKSGGN
jgi:probable DNA metabolism protein